MYAFKLHVVFITELVTLSLVFLGPEVSKSIKLNTKQTVLLFSLPILIILTKALSYSLTYIGPSQKIKTLLEVYSNRENSP